jgi:tetratricopeptide (TPR) repeat protein
MKKLPRPMSGIFHLLLVFSCINSEAAGSKHLAGGSFSPSLSLPVEHSVFMSASAGYMVRQDTLQSDKSKEQRRATMYEQAQKYAAAGSLEMAIGVYEELLKESPNYEDANARLQVVREQLEERQLADRLESEYAIGMALLKAHDWTRAVMTFENVLEMDRTFRDARRRLAEAKRGLDKEGSEIITARYFADGMASMNQNDLGRALAAFEKVKSINPAYRNVESLVNEIESKLGERAQGTPLATLDSLYHHGVAAQEQQDWLQAVVAYEKVQLLQPSYRDVAERLVQTRAQLNRPEAYHSATAAELWYSPLYVGGAMVGVVIIPLLGMAVFSPTARARYHLLRGRYAAAAEIYERVLARHPERAKLYSALANLYLLLGRHDERALKVYKTTLQLNLSTRNRDELNSIVAQQFLSEGRTDSEAIEVLEGALKEHQRKHRVGVKGEVSAIAQ